MATDNDTKLTRYTSAVTIVTADTMNKLYGGEFGFNETVGEFDPLVYGHVHDGKHQDGHASKILLTSGAHVRGYLGNANLGGTNGTTPAVRYSNILCYSEATFGSPAARRAAAAAGGYDLEILAIPEYVEVDGDKCYYLDLSNSAGGVDGSVQFNEAGAFGGNSDLFYDYTSMLLGLGTNTPARKLHVVGDGASPPIRVENVTEIGVAGTGKTLVFDSTTGDFYTDESVSGAGAFETTANVTSNSPGDLATDDFVFGSDSLDDDTIATHDSRMLFDKSRYAFRAGKASTTQFDETNRGFASAVLGEEGTARAENSMTFSSFSTNDGAYSGILSGLENYIVDPNFTSPGVTTSLAYAAVIAGGNNNQIDMSNVSPGGKILLTSTVGSGILAGFGNRIYDRAGIAFIGSGQGNTIGESVTSTHYGWGSSIVGGDTNKIASTAAAQWGFIGGGAANTVNSGFSLVVGGEENDVSGGDYQAIGGGKFNIISSSGAYNVIAGGGSASLGDGNEITGTAAQAAIVGGRNNTISIDGSFIGGGEGNDISIPFPSFSSSRSVITGGFSNSITADGTENGILSGSENTISAKSARSCIVGGGLNSIADSEYSIVTGGASNSISSGGGGDYNAIVGGGGPPGFGNAITGISSNSSIVGGFKNGIVDALGSFIGGGSDNAILGNYSAILSGQGCTIGASYATNIGGSNNVAIGSYTTTLGNGARAANYGQFSMASGTFSAAGDAQKSEVIWRGITSGTGLTEIFLDGSGQRFGVRDETTCAFKIIVVARNESNSRQGTWEIFGAVQRSGGGATFPVAPSVTTLFAAAGMSVVASVLGNDLRLQVQDSGVVPGDTTAWVAHGRMVHVTY